MQKVIIINLNGNAYQLDEDAYDALRAYLDNAAAQLASNPDKSDIAPPFRVMRHAWSYRYGPYYGHIGAEVWGGVIWLGFVILFFWFAYEHAAMFRDFLRTLPVFDRGWGQQV